MIAILALFLSFSETLGKGAQTEAITKNIEASDLWAFFQAKDIRRTVVNVGGRSDESACGRPDRSGRQGRDRQADRDLAEDRRALRVGPEGGQRPQGT